MSLIQDLSSLALRQLLDGACAVVGLSASGDAVVELLTNHFTDHSQRLSKALQTANDRAWKSLEIALAGDSFWDRCKVALSSGEDQAFRQQVRDFLDASPYAKLNTTHAKFCQLCLGELRRVRKRGVLQAGKLVPAELAQQVGTFARFSDPDALLDAEWKVIDQMAGALHREECLNLAKLLALRPKKGASMLAVGARYFFRREVETDPELFQGLAFAKLEAVQEGQQRGFAALSDALTQQGQRLEKLLDDVRELVTATLGVTREINTRVQGLEQQIQTVLGQLQLQGREVRPSDSLSIRNEGERQLVKRLVAEYRSLPEEQRRQLPTLLNNVGKLEVVAGEFEAAQRDFEAVAAMAPDPKAQAEAHWNAYRAALERQQWEEALAAIRQATALDPARYAPFPLDRFEPQHILGAGDFGVVFLCQHRRLMKPVVIKALQADELNRTVDDVFAEARMLEELDHPTIIKLRDCDYADAAATRPYLVMDYFEGLNLESYVAKHGLLSKEDLLAVAVPMAEALQAAHARGILHRDVKVANCLVRRDGPGWRVKLIDFGLALRHSATEGDSTSGTQAARTTLGKTIAGTRSYAAPEQMGQLPGIAAGPYSDVYGFGKTCYYALLGTPEPDDVEKETLPEGWRKFLARCTGRTLANRWRDFAEVLAVLAELRRPTPVKPAVPGPTPEERAQASPGQLQKTAPAGAGVVPASATPLFLKVEGGDAEGYEIEGGFVVRAGSKAVQGTAETFDSSPALVALRNRLIEQGMLLPEGGQLRLTRDYTPSFA